MCGMLGEHTVDLRVQGNVCAFQVSSTNTSSRHGLGIQSTFNARNTVEYSQIINKKTDILVGYLSKANNSGRLCGRKMMFLLIYLT
jgi:hypothetical protein